MTDLDHTYTSDISFQETFAFSADTQFSSQREGQNINFLLDQFDPITTALNTIDATAGKFTTFSGNFNLVAGDNVIYNGAVSLDFAILFISPASDNFNIGKTGFGLGTDIPGPPVPIFVHRRIVATTNVPFQAGSALIRPSVAYNPTYLGIIINANGGTNVNVTGIIAYA